MRRNSNYPRHFLIFLAALHLIAAADSPAGAASSPSISTSPDTTRFVLDEAGRLLRWDSATAVLEPIPDFSHTVNDLATIPGGPLMLALPSSPQEEGKRRRKREGRVLILRPTVAGVAIIREIVFEGEGIRAAVSLDGETAYILALRPGRSIASGVGVWIHALDLAAGKTTGSAALAGPPFGMALAADGRRLFLSRPGRIETLTTEPLIVSWHYRSPGQNLGLNVNRHDGSLYVTREREIAQFDPRVIEQRSVEERRAMSDDASLRIALSIEPHQLTFSGDGRIGAAFGRLGRIAFFDPEGGNELGSHDLSERGTPIEALQTVRFAGTGPLLLAAFPGPSMIRLPVPVPAPLVVHRKAPDESDADAVPVTPYGIPLPPTPRAGDMPAPTLPAGDRISPAADHDGRSPIGAEVAPTEEAASPESMPDSPIRPHEADSPAPQPGAREAEFPLPPNAVADVEQERAPTPWPDEPLTLQGTIAGEVGLVGAIVIYGPGSIVREAARVRPGADGHWKTALAEPGRYRVVPVGAGTEALRIRPHFHTVEVRGGKGAGGIDFEIRRSP